MTQLVAELRRLDQLDELSTHDLARLAVRQALDEHDVLGDLVDREALLAVRLHVTDRHGRGRHDGHAHPLAHLRVGNAGRGDVGDGRMVAQHGFDLDRAELLPTAVDRVRESATRVDVAIGVESREVAGVQPSRLHVLVGEHPQLADVAGGNLLGGDRIDDANLDARKRAADGPDPLGREVISGRERGVGTERLGLPEDVGERDVRERGHRALDELDGSRGGAVVDRQQSAEVGPLEVGMVEDALEHGRHEERRRDPVLRHQAEPLSRVEAGLDHRRPARLQRTEQAE